MWLFRLHGTTIGQVLLDAGFIEDVIENHEDFVDGNSLYRFCSVLPSQINKNVTTPKSRVYGNKNNISDIFYYKLYVLYFKIKKYLIIINFIFALEKQSSNVSNGSFKLDLDLHNNTVQISKPSSQKMKQNSGICN